MALDMKAIGRAIGPLNHSYTVRDAILYALAVGAGASELEFCYEKYLKILPTFPMATTFDFFWHIAREAHIDVAGILHGEHELIFHNPIPREGTFITNGTITDYFDKGKDRGALVVGRADTFHSNGEKIVTNVYTLFARFDGGFESNPAPKQSISFPARNPDFIVDAAPSLDQHLLYRLTGDYFELHVDPKFARKSGFDRPIMHGACFLGYGCRALIRKLSPGKPEKLQRLACRFSRPLYPGTPIQTHIWKTAADAAFWRVVNRETGEIVIDNGIAEF